MIGEHLTPREAKPYLERNQTVSVIERGWIDEHLRTCGECAALCARLGGYGTPRSEEEAANVLERRWRR